MFAEDEATLLLDAAGSPEDLAASLARRVAGQPLEHVLGWVAFAGLRIAVEPGVFVPRRRTELLVSVALARSPRVVLDLCCGAGAVGAALLPGVELHAADIDPVAVRCARRNLPGAAVYEGDLYDPLPGALRGRVDLVVANAPYVPSGAVGLMPPEARLYEPRVALDGGDDGLGVLRRVIAGARPWLAPGGAVLVESGSSQVDALCEALTRAGFTPDVARSDDLDATAVLGNIRP